MKKILLLIIICLTNFSCSGQGNIFGGDIRLYKNTYAKELAKAVMDEDIDEINELLKLNPSLVNFREPKFGENLLIFSIKNLKYKSTEALLINGADPNLKDDCNGESAMTVACNFGPNYEDLTEYVRLLLKYKGNPNIVIKTGESALIEASNTSLESLKLLLKAGANVNYYIPLDSLYAGTTALTKAAMFNQIEIVKYLIDNGADICLSKKTTLSGDTIKFDYYLRHMVFELDSKDYQLKMDVVKILKERCGIDYWSSPVPKEILEHYSAEFCKKY